MSQPFEAPLDASTRICAVYGHPVRHSASPAMQNAGIAELALNWRYLACEVAPEDLRVALAGAKAMNFIGLNLTVPHKLLAVELVDALDDSAREWGAVNTVRFEGREQGGTWRPMREFAERPPEARSHGFNTDADAIVRSLREDLSLELAGTKVLILGAGGAGRTAALRLAREGVSELFLVNRTAAKAAEVAGEIRRRNPAAKVSTAYPQCTVDLVLNATSLGLGTGDALPVDERQFSLGRAGAVYDMIYRPAETALLKAAKAAGCRAANGVGMLLHQGARALELWSGQTAPVEAMRRALHASIYGI